MASSKRFTINDDDREEHVLNHEGLYNDHRQSGLSMRKYIRQNRESIDLVILTTAGQ